MRVTDPRFLLIPLPLVAMLTLAWPAASVAQDDTAALAENRPPHRIPRVDCDIKADGILDEPCWSQALVMQLEYEVRPGENIPPPVTTDVLLAYNASNVLVAFRAYDPSPRLIRAHLTDRDRLWDDEWVAINFDTFNDQRRSYLFVVNPLGIQADHIENEGGPGCPYDAIWDSGGRINDEGYFVEMVIPFRALRFQRSDEDQIWGVDAIRSYAREVRHHIGLFPRDRNNNCYLCQAEKIVGFAGATPGRGLEFDPTVSARKTQARQSVDEEDIPQGEMEDVENKVDVGVTGKWGFTPNLTLCGTINPDFSQIEADILQLDVNTQYALYYPERRPFFLEGMDMFNSRLNFVYTRTLADPEWGIKVTGKEGSNVIGFFTVQDAVTNFLFPTAYYSWTGSLLKSSHGSVLRYRSDFHQSASLGFFVTNRAGPDYFNRLAAIDGNIRVTRKDRIRFEVLATQTEYPTEVALDEEQPEGKFTGTGFDFHYFHNTRTLDWYAMFRRLTPGVRADLGYRPQVDYNFGEGGLGYTFNREAGSWWTMLNFGGSYQYEETTTHELIQKGASGWFNYQGPMESFADANVYIGRNHWEGQDYEIESVFIGGGLWPSDWVFLELGCVTGDRIDYVNSRPGKQLILHPRTMIKLGLHLEIEYEHEYRHLNVEGGRLFTVNRDYLRMVYQFNKRTFVRLVLQYVNEDHDTDLYIEDPPADIKRVFTQLLFSYKINPQTVLYLGYSDNYFGNEDFAVKQDSRTFFAKIGYALIL
jgi:hypothetical protein